MSYVVPKAAKTAALIAYRTGSLNGGACGLFTNAIVPDENTLVGAFVEPGAEWPGYSRQTVATWGPVHQGVSGPRCETLIQIAGPTSGAGDDVVGWFYVDSGGVLVASGVFDEGPQPGTIVGGSVAFVLEAKGLLGGAEIVVPA